jgi:outer membrane protein
MLSSSNKRWFAAVACAAAWLALAHGAGAQTALADAEIGLHEALRRARIDTPRVAAAAAAYTLRQAEQSAARGAYFPVLTAQGTSGYSFDNRLVLPGAPRIDSKSLTTQGSVSLEWAALDFARGARVDAAGAAARAQALATAVTQRDAVLLAAELYVAAAAAVELTSDAELTLTRRSEQERAIAGLVQAGTRSPLDMERAKIETLSARYAYAASQIDEVAACAALSAAIGRPATQPVQPRAGSLQALEFELSPSGAFATARGDRPELAGQAALIDARQYDHSAAIAARLPTVGIAALASVSYLDVRSGAGIGGHQYGGSALVYVRWSGLDPAVWTRASVTDAAVAQAERELTARRHALATQAVAAVHAAVRAKSELERAVAVLRASEVTREVQNGRYRAGVASMLELLDAENLEQQARRRRIEAERDHYLAGARLLWASGRIDALAN